MTLALVAGYLLLQSVTAEMIEHAQAGVTAQQQGKLDVAIREFKKVTELQPEAASSHANLGSAYFQDGDYAAAIPELDHALMLNPNLMGTHQTLGVALLMQGDAEAALPHLEKTHPPDLLGLAYLETGRLGSAVVALKAALDQRPDDADLLYYFGRAAAAASQQVSRRLATLKPRWEYKSTEEADNFGRPSEDIVELQKAVAGKPEDPLALLAFGRAAEAASKQAFDRIVRDSAGSARAHQVAAERYVESGLPAEAAREYLEALRLRPYTAHVHFALGNVLLTQGKVAEAAAQYRIETHLRPLSPEAYYSLGSLLMRAGKPAAALEELAHADRLKPDSAPVLLALGRAAAAAGDGGRAEATWTKLLILDKGSGLAAAAHLELSMLYRRSGRPQEADREMAAYQQLKKPLER